MRHRASLAAGSLAFLAAAALSAGDRPVSHAGPAVYHPVAPKAAAVASDLVMAAPRLPLEAKHSLGPLSASEKAALSTDADGNLREKRGALRVGVSRDLAHTVGFAALPAPSTPGAVVGGGLLEYAAGESVWTAAFSSAGAGALRLHVRRAQLPPGSRAYVYSAGGAEVHGPYTWDKELPPEGFWTNTVFANEVFLEVRVPAGTHDAVLSVDAIVHLEHPAFAPSISTSAPRSGAASARPKSDACFIDVSCVSTSDFPNVDQASDAVAQLTFNDQGGAFVCSGGLLNATPSTFVPYLLTANHCFDNQASATSLEAIWQFRTSSCNGVQPDPANFPRTLGSTLLATSKASDFTFVQLSQPPPANSVFLGWDTTDYSMADGTLLYRVSYPGGNAQIFTKEQVTAAQGAASCSDAPQGLFLYEKDVEGGTAGGSSGSPLYLPDLSVVGQLFGCCGVNCNDDCDSIDNSSIDGAFRVTFPSVRPWLQPATAGAPCVVDANTLCLNNGRFKVTTDYANSKGQTGSGTGVSITGDTGYFWFRDPSNIEIVVKVLNACTQSTPRYWVFAGGLTNQHVVLTVVDTTTGVMKTYENALNTPFVPLQDTDAFVCP